MLRFLSIVPFLLPICVAQGWMFNATTSWGILSRITPTLKKSDVPSSTLTSFYSDAWDFYTSYKSADKFGLTRDYFLSPPPTVTAVLDDPRFNDLITLYYVASDALLADPGAFITSIGSAAGVAGPKISSSIMSQMSGILQGYESIATKDLLKATPTQAPVTPGKAVDSEEPVETSSSEGTSDKSGVPTDAVQSNTATTTLDNSALASSASSKAAAAPMATANAQVLINGVAAAVGVIGIAML